MAETATATATATLLDIEEIPFSDLRLLLSPETADDDLRRHILTTVGAALGRGGSGLMSVSDVPRAGVLRRRLLPLARRLALMDHPSRARLLKKYGLGSDVSLRKLDRSVSSFAQLLRHPGEFRLLEWMNETESTKIHPDCSEETVGTDRFGEADNIENLGELFKELGLCMMELGILVARACDLVIGGNQLEQSITDSGTAKARLIHYHSELDNTIIRESSTNRKGFRNKAAAAAPISGHLDLDKSCFQRSGSLHGSCVRSEDETAVTAGQEKDSNNISNNGQGSAISLVNLWQEWHYDYGTVTVLTAPLFLSSTLGEECSISEECSPPDGHTYLQLCNKKSIFSVRCSEESFIVQIGEAADILSGGKLRSTLHAVSRPLGLANISRETFVVFLQPSWDKILPCSGHSFNDKNGSSLVKNNDESSDHKELAFSSDGSAKSCGEHILMEEILKKIPPLSSRLKEGMTFAEFSRQTTKQYYGGGGIQQNN